MSSSFNAEIAVTELLTKTLENVAKDLARRCIEECGLRHGFDVSEEIRMLGLEKLNLVKKKMVKSSSSTGKEKKARVVKEKKVAKSMVPMAFDPCEIREDGCQGLIYNRGLFTQCTKSQMENGEFCTSCQSEADKNASGCPDCGTVGMRLNSGLYEFKDPKGRSPVSYLKVLEKLGLTVEQATEEAGKSGKTILAEHLQPIEKKVQSRGRPKKQAAAVEADAVSDYFVKATPDVQEVVEVLEEQPKKSAAKKLSEEEKEEKKKELEAIREQKKAERLQEKEAKRLEKEAKMAEEKAAKEAKLAEEKAAKEAKLAEEKAAKEAKRQAEKEAKEAKKTEKSKKAKTVEAEPMPAPVAAATPAPAKVTVTRITIDGVEYLKSAANILYDVKTKEEMGLYDPITKTMKELPEEEEEEEEEEYEEEN